MKLHITHFQLRNLVCSSSLSKGVFYPLSYFHDHNLDTVNNFSTNESIHSFFKINRIINDYEAEVRDSMKLDCIVDSRTLLSNSNSRISTLNCSDKYLVSGTFEGNYILTDISDPDNTKHLGEYNLTNEYDGITNSIIIDKEELIISSNDKSIRYIDLNTNSKTQVRLPFAGNCLALNKFNPNEVFISADDLISIVYDKRTQFDMNSVLQFKGQEDHSFSCDWSPSNENWLLAGNQDGNVRIWDKRNCDVPLYCWNGSLGNSTEKSGPVRNTKFSNRGEFVCWAESLDHIGLLNVNDLSTNQIDRVQSIEFIGKCTGLSFCESDNGYGEQLLIGVNDCPLGGILSYGLESRDKCLDFDFYF